MKRRTFPEIRKLILRELSKGQKTINEIAEATGLTWRTVDKHMIYLIGLGKAEPVLITRYVKIYKVKE